jgi:hypothetical protein
MKRLTMTMTLLAALSGAGLVAAQTAAKSQDEHAAHHPDKTAPAPAAGAGAGGGHGMMGEGGMMGGGGGMMGMCPGMLGPDAKFEVKKLAKGATITITSDDPKAVARIQKMAEGMRLMHEANAK